MPFSFDRTSPISMPSLKNLIFTLIYLLTTLLPATLAADVVRPALVEISINASGAYRIEIRASIEALLTGINAAYTNTRDAPTAEAYDALRALQASQLDKKWQSFRRHFAGQLELRFDGQPTPLTVTHTRIPEPGYTGVPRISVITLEGRVEHSAQTVDWYYPAVFGDSTVRVRQVDEVREKWHWSEWQWLRGDERSGPFSLTEVFSRRSLSETVWLYVVAGFEHILPKGLDHILFILGIFLLGSRIKPLLWQVTMFTVAHTVTLGLTVAGYINLPASIVEPLIALSIAYIGLENIRHVNLHGSRLLLVFAFGLLHGMGFAGVLQEFGMPDDAFLTALISFNIGVELGQLAIILLAFLAVGVCCRHRQWYRAAIIVPGSAAIAMTGLYWTFERLPF